MCLDSVACVRRQPGRGTTLFQDFETMPIPEERTSDNPCYLFAQHIHRKISLSALLRWLHIFLPLQNVSRGRAAHRNHAIVLAYHHIPPAVTPWGAQRGRWWCKRHHKVSGPVWAREKKAENKKIQLKCFKTQTKHTKNNNKSKAVLFWAVANWSWKSSAND